MKAQLRKVIPAMLALLSLNAAAVTRYVDLNSPSPTPPYTNWLTAATNIQDAVDVAVDGDLVLVTNGVYDTGGKGLSAQTNRVAITNLLTLKSANGPAVTTIVGKQVPGTTIGVGAVRCVYLADGATLGGFTLTNGATELGNDGGGIQCDSVNSTVTNCILTHNASGNAGGGASGGTFYNCTFIGNQSDYGGGAYNAVMGNCALTGNSAGERWRRGQQYDEQLFGDIELGKLRRRRRF